MAESSGSTPKIALLDTSVASAVAKGELSTENAAAILAISDAVQKSDVTLWASTVMKREMDRVPPKYRQPHLDQYNALRTVAYSATTNWIDDRPKSTSFGKPTIHPTFALLTKILSDKADAELVFQAKAHGVQDVITVDKRTMLNKAAELKEKVGVNVWSPAEYAANVLKAPE